MKAFAESILACIKENYIYVDSKMKIVHFNESLKALFSGNNQTELKPQRNICDYLDESIYNVLKCELELMESGNDYSNADIKLGVDYRGIVWRVRIIKDSSGKIKGYLFLAEQVLENTIQKDIVDVDQFAVYLSHHLRAPVATILGLSDLIHMGIKDQDLSFALISIEKSAKRLDMVIHELNDWLRCPKDVRI